MTKEALIIVDVQNDFCPGGSLEVTEGDKVVTPLNNLSRAIRTHNGLVFASRDWHRVDNTLHMGPGKWPIHCIQDTLGAQFHPELDLTEAQIISKGMGVESNAYSAFEGLLNDNRPLESALRESRIDTLYIGGLATDYCVKATVLSALKLGKEIGFKVVVIKDAIRAVNQKGGEDALLLMTNEGAELSTSEQIIAKYMEQ